MGVWVVGALPDQTVRDLQRAAVPEPPPAPLTPHHPASAELAWWRSRARHPMFTASRTWPGGWDAGDDAFRLSAFLDTCYDASEAAESLRDTVMDQFPQEFGESLFAAVARKAGPFSALAYALGPEATLRFPGRFGEFLFDAGQVRARLPAAEEVLALTGARRRDAADRVHAWLTGLGDAPGHDAGELLDGPLRVLRYAARTGRGAAGLVRWY
ncbi:hypothetical protein VT52_005820 [Streptomyces malaysiense]|uniref:Uncharacterized protein n=2 Tax=Streptomyces malaysiense TaxID=1428626 RepID=A0A1J4Q690_9ACTN|nr:hypothetical protein VT52_005820 [Streptomyces malaysiense]